MAETGTLTSISPGVVDTIEPTRVLVPSPLGTLGIEIRGSLVTRILIAPERHDRRGYSPLKEASRSDSLDEALGRLSEYFAAARRDPRLDFDIGAAGLDDTAKKILLETQQIPYGSTRSYQKVAAAVGLADSYRLVRSVLMANPIPILIPCHRVVARRGGCGSYIGGTKRKTWLLKLEEKGLRAESG